MTWSGSGASADPRPELRKNTAAIDHLTSMLERTNKRLEILTKVLVWIALAGLALQAWDVLGG